VSLKARFEQAFARNGDVEPLRWPASVS
jgi:predicted ATPase